MKTSKHLFHFKGFLGFMILLFSAISFDANAQQITKEQKLLIEKYYDDIAPNGQIKCITPEVQKLRYGRRYQHFVEKFEEYIARERSKLNRQNESAVVYTIPVIFHIIHNGQSIGTGSNVTAAIVQAQLDQLNNDFRKVTGTSGDGGGVDTEIEFCAALVDEMGNTLAEPGINRVNGTTISGAGSEPYSRPDFDNTIKPATQWNPDDYFNIWSGDLSGGLLGYAQFPEAASLPGIGTGNGGANTDGVVVLYSSMGSTDVPFGSPPYDKGRTLTHEVGHWLGLRHIWGDGGCGVDDFCADTPTSDASNFGCPTGHVSCGSTDQIENYMDYTDDDCMERFTQDQTDRMRIVMGETGMGSVRRESLLNSTVCNTADGFDIVTTNSPVTTCQPSNGIFNFDITFIGSFSGSITMSASGLPAGLSATFSTNPITSAGSYTMTISGTGSVAVGTYNFNIDGTDGGSNMDSEAVTLVIDAVVASAPNPLSPTNGASGEAVPVSLTWSSVLGASTYDIEVATDAGFSNIVLSQTGITGTSYTAGGLSPSTTYFWRVRGVSSCGDGNWSVTFNFTTSTVSPCFQYDGGPYIDFEPPACYPDCETSVVVSEEVWANESYLIRGLTPGAEYNFEFCSGYDANDWAANITVAEWDDTNSVPTTNVTTVGGCSVTFIAPASGDIIVIIFDVCGNAELQVDNGLPTFQCTGNGPTLPTACPIVCSDSNGFFENFEGGQPSGWTFGVTGTPSVSWQFDDQPIGVVTGTITPNPGSGNWAYYDDDAAGSGSGNNIATATTPTIDMSAYQNITLNFDYAYNALTSDDVSLSITDGSSTYYWNGNTWVTTNSIWLNTDETGSFDEEIPTTLNSTSLSITFTYDDASSWAWGFGFDNFGLCGEEITTNCLDNLTINDDPILPDTYSVVDSINSEGTVQSPDTVTFEAGILVRLNPGFEVENGATFTARIQSCTPTANNSTVEERNEEIIPVSDEIKVYPNPFSHFTTIEVQLAEYSDVEIGLYSLTGKRLSTIAASNQMQSGTYQFSVDATNFDSGIYLLMIRIDDKVQTKKLSLIK